MAPTLAALLEAARLRSDELEAERTGLRDELASLDERIAEKRAERTIAAQNETREFLKQKEALMKKSKLMEGAAGHVRLAVEKLERAHAAGLEDWKELREEQVKLSDFAKERLADSSTWSQIEAASGGGSVKLDGGTLVFVGGDKGFKSLKQALDQLESGYSCTLEVERVAMDILDRRNEFKKQGDKFGVEITKEASGCSIRICGPACEVRKAEDRMKWLLRGRADLYCPKEFSAAARVQAKDVEVETGSYIDLSKPIYGGNMIHIRGDSDGVREAEEKMRAWLDEREGKYSIHIEVPALAKLNEAQVAEFHNDLPCFAQTCGIDAWLGEDSFRVELRGPADGKWEARARDEFKRLSEWYASRVDEGKAKAAQKPAEADVWGSAPEAEFELGHKW